MCVRLQFDWAWLTTGHSREVKAGPSPLPWGGGDVGGGSGWRSSLSEHSVQRPRQARGSVGRGNNSHGFAQQGFLPSGLCLPVL